jgi:hypothetical protein
MTRRYRSRHHPNNGVTYIIVGERLVFSQGNTERRHGVHPHHSVRAQRRLCTGLRALPGSRGVRKREVEGSGNRCSGSWHQPTAEQPRLVSS